MKFVRRNCTNINHILIRYTETFCRGGRQTVNNRYASGSSLSHTCFGYGISISVSINLTATPTAYLIMQTREKHHYNGIWIITTSVSNKTKEGLSLYRRGKEVNKSHAETFISVRVDC